MISARQIVDNPRVSNLIARGLVDGGMNAAEFDEPFRVDAWVDELGRVRKFEMRTDADRGRNEVFRTTSRYEDSVSGLTAPDRAAVLDYTKFLRLAEVLRRHKAGSATAADTRLMRQLSRSLGLDDPVAWTTRGA